MKKLSKRTLASLGLMGSLLLTGAHAEEQKAKTIAELVARYDSSSCVDCHMKEYDESVMSG